MIACADAALERQQARLYGAVNVSHRRAETLLERAADFRLQYLRTSSNECGLKPGFLAQFHQSRREGYEMGGRKGAQRLAQLDRMGQSRKINTALPWSAANMWRLASDHSFPVE